MVWTIRCPRAVVTVEPTRALSLRLHGVVAVSWFGELHICFATGDAQMNLVIVGALSSTLKFE
jgi:hypothetical protein